VNQSQIERLKHSRDAIMEGVNSIPQ
jgi:hypothetical protein